MDLEQITKVLNVIARHEISNKYDEAMAALRPLLDTSKPGPRVVEAYARLSVHFNEREQALIKVEETLKGFSMSPQIQSGLQFQAGNLYDHLGEYDKAFQHYKSANDILPVNFDVRVYEPFIEAMKNFFTSNTMNMLARADVSDVTPVFIVGMPRSGTTLTEQIMDRHTQVHGAGELSTMNDIIASLQQRYSLSTAYPDCLTELRTEQLNSLANQYITTASEGASEAAYVADKMPSNCGHLGLIEMIFPSARVIHCRRDPIDTCLSCYFQNFANTHQYSRRLDDLAKMYRIYLKMVNMWEGVLNISLHESRYEDMVDNQEGSSRRLIEFIGLDWEDQCLSFYESERDINTCSYNQVRKPIYNKSVNRWKNYEKHIGPLSAELEDIIEQYNSN